MIDGVDRVVSALHSRLSSVNSIKEGSGEKTDPCSVPKTFVSSAPITQVLHSLMQHLLRQDSMPPESFRIVQ